jgi:hypothetical protein
MAVSILCPAFHPAVEFGSRPIGNSISNVAPLPRPLLSIEICTNDRVVGRFNDCRQVPAGFFVAFALGDVAQIRCEKRRSVDFEWAYRKLDENFRTIAAHTGNFDPFSKQRPFTCSQIMS